jgi:hypothetical protein
MDSLVLNENGLVMKRIIIVMVLFAGVAAMSYGKVITKGESNTPFGSYTLEAVDQPLTLAGETVKCYLLSYENSPIKVKIYVDKEKNCKNYVVVSDDLAVMYSCNGKYFGVNKVDKKYKIDGIHTDDSQLDRTGYFRQKVLTQGATEEQDAAMLIASYFPMLLKDS